MKPVQPETVKSELPFMTADFIFTVVLPELKSGTMLVIAVPMSCSPKVVPSTVKGHERWASTSGGNGVCVKSNASIMLFASASRLVRDGRLKVSSIKRKTLENSYWV